MLLALAEYGSVCPEHHQRQQQEELQVVNNMGTGGVSTRSGFNSDYHEGSQRSLCRKWMWDVSAFIRDLTIFFWWILPSHAVNTRLYLLVLARLVIYTAEGVAFYSLVATVLAGTEEEVEWLVELTRIVLCEVSDKMGTRGTRAKREADSWADLVQRVNSTRPKMAEILQDLYQTSTKSSLDYITDITTEVRELTELTNGTLVTGTSFPTLDNDSLYMGHHYTTTDATDPNHTSGLADYIPTRSSFGGNMELGRNITDSTTALQFNTYNTSQDTPEVISYQTTQVVFEFCTRVENLTDQEISISCVTGLAIPLCLLGAVVISSTVCGYVLARVCSKRQNLVPTQITGSNPLPSACSLPANQP